MQKQKETPYLCCLKNNSVTMISMKKMMMGVGLLMVCVGMMAQTGKEWDDPMVTSVNRETAHSLAIPMVSEE